MQTFVVNMDFDGGTHGEIIEAEPSLIADWIAGGFVSPVDERGERVTALDGVPLPEVAPAQSDALDAHMGDAPTDDASDGGGDAAA